MCERFFLCVSRLFVLLARGEMSTLVAKAHALKKKLGLPLNMAAGPAIAAACEVMKIVAEPGESLPDLADRLIAAAGCAVDAPFPAAEEPTHESGMADPWKPNTSLTLSWNDVIDEGFLRAHEKHGAPSKTNIVHYLALLPGISAPQIYGRGSYYCSTVGLPKQAQCPAAYVAIRSLRKSGTTKTTSKTRPLTGDEAEEPPRKLSRHFGSATGPF